MNNTGGAERSDRASMRSIDRSVISTPSDEKVSNRPLQKVEEGYHSVPASGVALNVGISNSRIETASIKNNDNLQIHNKNSTASFTAALETDQHQEAFEDDFASSDGDELTSKIKQLASEASTMAWEKLVSGDTPLSKRKTFVQACYLGIAAIFGTLLRLILAQLFGQACSNPETIGWIADESVLCVTRDGTTTQNEGIIFADLPANLLGSFLMGLLQDGVSLGLAVNLPIVFLRPSNSFQSFDIWHTALKTGFCGSLTTFSAWNSEMVVMMVGHFEVVSSRQSMVWRALFGYIIGMETAIGSYVFGRTVAWWLHQWVNPELAKEQKALSIRETKHGIAINRELPLVERRYLHGISEADSSAIPSDTDSNSNSSSSTPLSPVSTLTEEELAPLRRWRESTKEARRVESGISGTLLGLETSLIARKEVLTNELRETANCHDWDIDGLMEWLSKRQQGHLDPLSLTQSISLTASGVSETLGEEDTVWYSAPAAGLLLAICLMILVVLVLHWDAKTAYEITYRTMAYSMFFATPGALLRWKLSAWNGKLGTLVPRFNRMSWLPIGTLAANVLGAMVSITMIAWEFNLAGTSGFWGIATVRAIKIGFSGCLSTVSTFVSEVHKLTNIRLDRGYKYILITLTLSCVTGMILFVIVA